MKKLLITTLVSLAMNFSITDVLAQSQNEPYAQTFAQTQLSDKDQKVLSVLQKAYPQNRIRLARETPIAGFYEVILGEGVSYVFLNEETLKNLDQINEANRDTYFRHWIFGGVFYDMQKKTDLTAPMKTLAQMADVTKFPETGDVKHTLYVFTDPRCPFCKKLEAELVKLKNVRIHTFLTPLTSLHPDAKEVSARIWCSENPAKAFENFMLRGLELKTEAKCATPITQNEKLMTELGIKGTPTLFFENGERVTGALSAEAIEEKFKQMDAIKDALQKSLKEKK